MKCHWIFRYTECDKFNVYLQMWHSLKTGSVLISHYISTSSARSLMLIIMQIIRLSLSCYKDKTSFFITIYIFHLYFLITSIIFFDVFYKFTFSNVVNKHYNHNYHLSEHINLYLIQFYYTGSCNNVKGYNRCMVLPRGRPLPGLCGKRYMYFLSLWFSQP